MSKKKVAEVHFSIHGDYITDFFRTRVLEGEWEDALRGLMVSFDSMDYEIATAIFKGEKKFIGVNDLELVDDNDCKEYLDQLKWMYTGYYKHDNNRWYKPYKAIMTYNEKDWRFAKDLSGFGCNEDIIPLRWKYYQENQTDICFNLKSDNWIGPKAVLFKRVDAPPFWYKIPKQKPQKCLDNHSSYLNFVESDTFDSTISPDIEPPISLKESNQVMTEINEAARLIDDDDLSLEELDERNRLEDEQQEKEYQKRFVQYKQEIIEQANEGHGWLDLELESGKTVSVPRAPFYNWADTHINGKYLPELEWEPVCPTGLKMFGDNVYHTDWMVGAGLDLENSYDHNDMTLEGEVMSAAFTWLWEVDRRVDDTEKEHFTTLVKNSLGRKTFVIYKPEPNDANVPEGCVIAIPFAGPEYQLAAQRAGIAITQVGGKLCHLAKIGRELGIDLLLHPNVLSLFDEGDMISIDFNDKTIVKVIE